eukprot:6582060-Prymnesium_polylepis.1
MIEKLPSKCVRVRFPTTWCCLSEKPSETHPFPERDRRCEAQVIAGRRLSIPGPGVVVLGVFVEP